jgi:UDP-glucose 4-epimerase
MRILVTGGAGFIGSHIVDAYVAKGHKVSIVDNLNTGFRKNLNPKARFYKADVLDAKAIRDIIRKEQPEVLSHQAALVAVAKSIRDPLPTLAVNVLGTVNVLKAFGEASRAKKKKFIFASTGTAFYGDPKEIRASETTTAVPLSAYGLSKKMAEEAVRLYSRQFGFEHLIFRYANVYGPRQNPKGEVGAIAIFADLIKRGQRPMIFGKGDKTRDYIYVDDIVRANILGLAKGKGVELNLGWGREISDRQVFDAVARHFGYDAEPKYAPHREGEVHRITLDSKRAKRVLGWEPKITFEKGVPMTLGSATMRK